MDLLEVWECLARSPSSLFTVHLCGQASAFLSDDKHTISDKISDKKSETLASASMRQVTHCDFDVQARGHRTRMSYVSRPDTYLLPVSTGNALVLGIFPGVCTGVCTILATGVEPHVPRGWPLDRSNTIVNSGAIANAFRVQQGVSGRAPIQAHLPRLLQSLALRCQQDGHADQVQHEHRNSTN